MSQFSAAPWALSCLAARKPPAGGMWHLIVWNTNLENTERQYSVSEKPCNLNKGILGQPAGAVNY